MGLLLQSERCCCSSTHCLAAISSRENSFDSVSIVLLFKYSFFSGDIGGQMGLFIGASILTVLEILDYIYEVQCCAEKAHTH